MPFNFSIAAAVNPPNASFNITSLGYSDPPFPPGGGASLVPILDAVSYKGNSDLFNFIFRELSSSIGSFLPSESKVSAPALSKSHFLIIPFNESSIPPTVIHLFPVLTRITTLDRRYREIAPAADRNAVLRRGGVPRAQGQGVRRPQPQREEVGGFRWWSFGSLVYRFFRRW